MEAEEFTIAAIEGNLPEYEYQAPPVEENDE